MVFGEDGGKGGGTKFLGGPVRLGQGLNLGGTFFLMTGSLWADEDCGGKGSTLNNGRSVDVEMDVFHDRILDVKMVCVFFCIRNKVCLT